MTVKAPMWKSQSTITIPWKGNAEITVTELLSTTLDAARSVLIDVAKSVNKITYGGELAKHSGTGYPAQSMGKVLDVLSLDCSDRGSSPAANTTLARGQEVVVSANGMKKNSAGRALLASDPVLVGEFTTDDQGSAVVSFHVPSDAHDGGSSDHPRDGRRRPPRGQRARVRYAGFRAANNWHLSC